MLVDGNRKRRVRRASVLEPQRQGYVKPLQQGPRGSGVEFGPKTGYSYWAQVSSSPGWVPVEGGITRPLASEGAGAGVAHPVEARVVSPPSSPRALAAFGPPGFTPRSLHRTMPASPINPTPNSPSEPGSGMSTVAFAILRGIFSAAGSGGGAGISRNRAWRAGSGCGSALAVRWRLPVSRAIVAKLPVRAKSASAATATGELPRTISPLLETVVASATVGNAKAKRAH